MEKQTHTPGPWTIIPATAYDGDEDEFEGSYTSPAGIEGSDGSPVCVFGIAEGSGTLLENEADYRLIAAAPDLLAFAKALDASWSVPFPSGPDGDVSYGFGHLADEHRDLWRQCRAALALATGEASR